MPSKTTPIPTPPTASTSGLSYRDRSKTTVVLSSLPMRERLKSFAFPPRQPHQPSRPEPLPPDPQPPASKRKVKPLSALRVPTIDPSTVLVPATPSPPPPRKKPKEHTRSKTTRPSKPRETQRPQTSMARSKTTRPAKPRDPQLPPAHTVVKLGAIHGLGSGVFATASCKATDIIFAEKPLFKARRGADAREILEQTRGLPQQNLLLLLMLEANGGPNNRGLEAIFRSNAIPCVEEDEGGWEVPCAIFKYLSRVNHSCAPNAGWFWDAERNLMLVIAYRDIKPGDEITASYSGPHTLASDRATRISILKAAHHFTCICRICAHPHPDSDTNRARLGALLKKWEEASIDAIVANPAVSLSDTSEAARLAETENVTQALIYIYLIEFYVHAAWGAEAAREAAQNALRSLAKIRGWEAARKHYVAGWAEDPASYESWGILKAAPKRKYWRA